MPISLTSQEKKVLGFVILMTALGLVMLGVQGWQAPEKDGKRGIQATVRQTP